jgi:hypothetical protein
MNGTTTRARDRRGAADSRHVTPPRPRPRQGVPPARWLGGESLDTEALVDGSSALRIAYAGTDPSPAPETTVDPSSRRDAGPAAAPQSAAPPLHLALPRARFLVSVIAVVVVGVLGVLVLNTKINENAFRLDELRNRQTTLDLREQQLAQDLAERESPGNLAAAANRLGLVPADKPAFISLPDGRVVGVPQPARDHPNIAAPLMVEAGR